MTPYLRLDLYHASQSLRFASLNWMKMVGLVLVAVSLQLLSLPDLYYPLNGSEQVETCTITQRFSKVYLVTY